METRTYPYTQQYCSKTPKNAILATRVRRNNNRQTSVHQRNVLVRLQHNQEEQLQLRHEGVPQPPFQIECANAQLEQPIATADIQFNIGTYTFRDTFVILSKTSFPIIRLECMQNYQAVIDTANGIINFPHLLMTLAMTDETRNCNPKPLKILAEGNQTLLPQQTTTVNAVVITTNTNDVTGTIQPLPQFDETANIIAAPALATANNKRINIRIANLTDFPRTIKTKIGKITDSQTRR